MTNHYPAVSTSTLTNEQRALSKETSISFSIHNGNEWISLSVSKGGDDIDISYYRPKEIHCDTSPTGFRVDNQHVHQIFLWRHCDALPMMVEYAVGVNLDVHESHSRLETLHHNANATVPSWCCERVELYTLE